MKCVKAGVEPCKRAGNPSPAVVTSIAHMTQQYIVRHDHQPFYVRLALLDYRQTVSNYEPKQ